MYKVIVSGANLFQIAAEYLSDATMWIYLAELNHLQDPFLQGLTPIRIPTIGSLRSGGIPDA
jgi:hypothetical protein